METIPKDREGQSLIQQIIEKQYKAKKLMNKNETKIYEMLKSIFNNSYFHVFPQVGLRSIIDTPQTNKTSEELYRYVDFGVFDENYMPMLIIELNGENHSKDPFMIARDLSVEQILTKCEIPILTIWTNDLPKKTELQKQICDLIKHHNQKIEMLNYKKGQTVEHPKYGIGKITKISKDKLTGDIQFKDKIRAMLLETAELRILNKKEQKVWTMQ